MIKSKINFALFIVLACLWSGSFIAIKEVVDVWPPIFSAAVRLGVALISLMLLIFCTRKNIKAPLTLRWKIWGIGFFSQAIPFSFLFWAERLVSPGLAGILNATVSIWAFLLSLIFLPRLNTFSLLKLFGLFIGIAGITVIFWPMLKFSGNSANLLGALAVLAMAISYAIGALLNQYFLLGKTQIDFFTNVCHQHWASFIFLLVFSLIFEKWPSLNTLISTSTPWIASLYLGVCSTAIAFLIYYHLIREWDAVRASAVLYVVPVLTLIWDYLFYGYVPNTAEICGVIIILLGVIFIQLSGFRQIAKKI